MRFLLIALAVAGCSSRGPVVLTPQVEPDAHVPDYARRPFEPWSRTNAVAIALREWRAFGSMVDDGPPRAEPAARADNEPGLWQREIGRASCRERVLVAV